MADSSEPVHFMWSTSMLLCYWIVIIYLHIHNDLVTSTSMFEDLANWVGPTNSVVVQNSHLQVNLPNTIFNCLENIILPFATTSPQQQIQRIRCSTGWGSRSWSLFSSSYQSFSPLSRATWSWRTGQRRLWCPSSSASCIPGSQLSAEVKNVKIACSKANKELAGQIVNLSSF